MQRTAESKNADEWERPWGGLSAAILLSTTCTFKIIVVKTTCYRKKSSIKKNVGHQGLMFKFSRCSRALLWQQILQSRFRLCWMKNVPLFGFRAELQLLETRQWLFTTWSETDLSWFLPSLGYCCYAWQTFKPDMSTVVLGKIRHTNIGAIIWIFQKAVHNNVHLKPSYMTLWSLCRFNS